MGPNYLVAPTRRPDKKAGPFRVVRRGNYHFSAMSQHPSLRAAAGSGTKRSVLKRFERVELLRKGGQWKSGDRVTGLRKTKPPE